jgi:cytochrome P450
MASDTVAPESEAAQGKPLDFSLTDTKVLFNPNKYYGILRSCDPVHYDQQLGMYVVSRYEDLQEVLRDSDTYSLELGYHRLFGLGHLDELKDILNRHGGGYIPDFIMSDPPRHGRIRRLMEGAFRPHRLKQLEPAFTAMIGSIVEALADRGEADGIHDIAIPMTTGFMTGQLGLRDLDAATIGRWTHAYDAMFSGLMSHDEMVANAMQICELQNYIIDLVRRRQAHPGEDMISDLVTMELEDEENPRLSFEEIVALARALLIGGNDTIGTALSNLLFAIATRPEIAARLYESADDDRLLGRFVEEMLRLEPPVRGLSRVTTREVELGGTLIPKDAMLFLLFVSANDDEGTFESPRTFDMERSNIGKHLAFGAGIHRCVGLSLARMEVKLAAREIAHRLTDIRLAIPVEEIRYIPSIIMLSMESLPLKFRRNV